MRNTIITTIAFALFASSALAAPLTHSDRPMPRPAGFTVEGPKVSAPMSRPTYTTGERAAISRYNAAVAAATPAGRRALGNPSHPLKAAALAAQRGAANRAAQGVTSSPHTRGETAAINRYKAALHSARTPAQRAAVRNGPLGRAFIRAIDAQQVRTTNAALRPGQHMNRNGTALDDKNNQADD